MKGKYKPTSNASRGGGGLFADGTSSAAAGEMTGMSREALAQVEADRLGVVPESGMVRQPVITTTVDTMVCFTPARQHNTPLFVEMETVAETMTLVNRLPDGPDGKRRSRVGDADLVRRIAITVWNPSPFAFIAQLNLQRRSNILQISACVGSPDTDMTGHVLVPARMPEPVTTTVFVLDDNALDPTFLARNFPGWTLERIRTDLELAKRGTVDRVQLQSDHPIVGYISEQIEQYSRTDKPAQHKKSPEEYKADRRYAILGSKKDPRQRTDVRTLDVQRDAADAAYQVLAEDELRYITVGALRRVVLPSDVHRVDTSEERKVMLQFYRAHPTTRGEFNVGEVDREISPFTTMNDDGVPSSETLYNRTYLINVTFEIDTQGPPQKKKGI